MSNFIDIGPGSWKVYLASGWFNPPALAELLELENMFDEMDRIELAAPRRIFECPPDAPQDVQEDTFKGNVEHIETADFVFVNTRDKDIGTIWEAGLAYANNKPIIYFCAGLPSGAKFNLMLARSGIKVCTSIDEVKEYMNRCFENNGLFIERYDQDIE